MRLSRLYTDQALSVGESCALADKPSHYVSHVLRLKPQQHIIVFNGQSEHDYLAQLIKTGKKVQFEIIDKISTSMESNFGLHIYQAISKSDHLDFTLQKCTELGVKQFILFNSGRTQHPIKQLQLRKKMMHWQAVAQSACEQCGRSITPSIHFYSDLSTAMQHKAQKNRLLLDFDGEDIRPKLTSGSTQIDVLLGPEGGLNNQEIQLLLNQSQFKAISLGPRTLRTETAAIVACSIIQCLVGDLN